jgi:hypothetical protein
MRDANPATARPDMTAIKDISPKAVLIGAATDVVATNIAMAPIIVMFLLRYAPTHMAPAQQTTAFTGALATEPTLYLAALVLGSAASVLGGWVAARSARRAETLHGALSAIMCVGCGIYGAIRYPAAASLSEHLALIVLAPCLGAVGGAFRKRQDARPSLASNPAAPVVSDNGWTKRRPFAQAVFVANRVCIGVCGLAVVVFGLSGVYGYSQHQSAIISGSMAVCIIALIAALMFVVAARRLRDGRGSHWVFHGGALAVASIPTLLVLLARSLQH